MLNSLTTVFEGYVYVSLCKVENIDSNNTSTMKNLIRFLSHRRTETLINETPHPKITINYNKPNDL